MLFIYFRFFFASSDCRKVVVIEFDTITGQNLAMCHSARKVELAFVYQVAIELESLLPRLLLRLQQNSEDFVKAT